MGRERIMSDRVFGRTNNYPNYTEDFFDKGSIGAATVTINVQEAGMQKITATGNLTLAFSNIPPVGKAWHVTIEAVNWGAHTPVYPGALDTPGGTAFSLTSSGTDWLEFWGHEGSTTIHGAIASLDSK